MRKPKFKVNQCVLLDTTDGPITVQVWKVRNIRKYEVYHSGIVELVERGSLYTDMKEYKRLNNDRIKSN